MIFGRAKATHTMNTAKIFILTVLFLYGFKGFGAWNLREKDMKFERVRQCETGEYSPMAIEEFTIYQPEKKQYKINATINILEDIDSKSNIIFRMFVSRCSLSMLQCEEIETVAVPNVCQKFRDRGMLWTPVFDKIKPPLRCPLQKGKYSVINGGFDLSLMRRLPIDPEKLNVNLTLYEYVPDADTHRNIIKRQLICLEVKVTVTLARHSNATMIRPPMLPRNGAKPKN